VQRLLGVDQPTVEAKELVDELHRWALGLPFVEELEPVPIGSQPPSIRHQLPAA
jgi:hypothetical protein